MIGALRASLSADTANFEAGMKRARNTSASTANSIKKSFGGLSGSVKAGLVGLASGLSVGLFTSVVKGALDYAGSLGEVSQQLGVTTKDLQVFRYAAGQNGVAQEELDKGLGKLTITLGQVAAGAKAPTKALDAIGISARDLAGLDTGAAFRKIADGLSQIPDRAQRAAVEVALFGRSGAKLDTLLAGGSAAINELSAAAEKLGIVLSDEQIQKADETADKLDALKTVLSAQIAGVVADNADAILQFANALVSVVAEIGNAINAYRQLRAEFNSKIFGAAGFEADAARARGSAFKSGKNPTVPGRSVTIDLAPAKPYRPPSSGGNIKRYLASGGGGGGGRKRGGGSDDAERKRLEGIRDAYRFDEDLRRAEMDILRAKQDLAHDFVERTALSIQMLDLEKRSFAAELTNEVALGERTKAQAAQLQAEFDKADALKRQAVIEDEEVNRQRDYNLLAEKDFDLARTRLEKMAGLAETASERRAIELELLKLAYDERRRTLERITRESKDWAEIEAARRELAALPREQAADREGVIAGTRGPMEDYIASLPTTAAKAQEALERLQVEGFEGLIDAALQLRNGFKSAKDALLDTLKQFLLGFARMQLQRGLGSILSGGVGNIFSAGSGSIAPMINNPFADAGTIIPNADFGFARGGAFTIMGNRGVDRNVMSINGLPIANVSHGERVTVSNDNRGGGGGGGNVYNWNIQTPDADSFRRSERQILREQRRRLA